MKSVFLFAYSNIINHIIAYWTFLRPYRLYIPKNNFSLFSNEEITSKNTLKIRRNFQKIDFGIFSEVVTNVLKRKEKCFLGVFEVFKAILTPILVVFDQNLARGITSRASVDLANGKVRFLKVRLYIPIGELGFRE